MEIHGLRKNGQQDDNLIDVGADPVKFIKQLNASPCAEMKLLDDPIAKRRFRLPYEMLPDGYIPDEVFDVIESAQQWLQNNGMPPELNGNPFYRYFVAGNVTQEVIERNRALIFSPHNPDIENVMASIRVMAGHILEGIFRDKEEERTSLSEDEIEKARYALTMALYFTMVMNVNDFDVEPVFRTDIYNPQPREIKRNFVSAYDVRKAIRTLEKEFERSPSDRKDAVLYLMYNLGILQKPPQSMNESDKEKMKLDVQRSVEVAWKIYETIGTTLEQYRSDFGIEGEVINLDPNTRNKTRDLYGLLKQVFTNSEEADLKFVQEAQTIATLAYLVHRVRKHPVYMKAREILPSLAKNFIEEMFGPEEDEPKNTRYTTLYMDGRKNILPIDEEGKLHVPRNGEASIQVSLPPEKLPKNYKKIIVRKLQDIDGMEEVGEQEVHYHDLNCKEKESILMRLLTKREENEGSIDIEDLCDMLRGRLVLMSIQNSDIRDPEKGPQIKRFIENLGKKIGVSMKCEGQERTMQYQKYKNKKDCKPGEFIIEDKLDKTNNQKGIEYRAIRVYGQTFEGVRFEFQIIPRDTYEMSYSPQSPNHHAYYNLERILEIARIIFRRSIYPRVHEVIDREYQEIEQLKKDAVGEYNKIIELYLRESIDEPKSLP